MNAVIIRDFFLSYFFIFRDRFLFVVKKEEKKLYDHIITKNYSI